MLSKRTKIVMTAGCLIIFGSAVLICGFAYSIYSWLRVEPLVVLPDVAETDRIEVIDQWLEKQFVDFKFNGGVLILREG